MKEPNRHISALEAMELVIQHQPLIDFHITGTVDLRKITDEFKRELLIENCKLDKLDAPAICFSKKVLLIDSHFNDCVFNYAYFNGGLTIDNCIFENYLDFEAGGHNQNGNIFLITNSQFKSFVNFFDCWFQSDVSIIKNEFLMGTNLLGNLNESWRTQFDVEPVILDNTGRLNLNGDGNRGANIIFLNQI